MKTRIISAAVIIAVVLAAITVGKLWCPLVITAFLAVLCAFAVYELIKNVAKLQNTALTVVASVYGAVMVFLLDKKNIALPNGFEKAPLYFSIIYFLIAVFVVLYNHKDFSLDKILGYTAYPLVLSYGFSFLGGIISFNSGIYYLLLLINFASICDTGAYFVGSFLGKNKLCPEISPKKTVEGAIGGIASSVIVSLILVLCFKSEHLLATLLLTVPFCIVGMMGDLFASAIKRSVGLKDYSNLIPGHGGILDRFDSMLLIAPILYMFMEIGVI